MLGVVIRIIYSSVKQLNKVYSLFLFLRNLTKNFNIIAMRHFTLTLIFIAFTVAGWAQKAKNAAIVPPSKESSSLTQNIPPINTPLKGGGDVFWKEEFNWGDPTMPLGWRLPAGWKLEDPTASKSALSAGSSGQRSSGGPRIASMSSESGHKPT
jgi:hypothetical protein